MTVKLWDASAEVSEIHLIASTVLAIDNLDGGRPSEVGSLRFCVPQCN